MRKGWLILVIMLVSIIGFARAEITLDGPYYNAYNLGDKLNLNVNVIYPNTINGFLKTGLACETPLSQPDYSLRPISLSAGIVKKIQIDELIIQEGYTGNCNVVVELLNNARQSLEKSQSARLVISKELRMDSKLSKINLKPGEKLIVSGTVRNARDEKIRDGDVKIILEKEFFTKIKEGEFGYELGIGDSYKSGSHDIIINAEDANGNKAEATINFNVEAVPKKLELRLNEDEYGPKELLVVEALLYDQAEEQITGDASFKIYNPDNEMIMDRTFKTNEKVEYTLADHAEPGNYRILLSSSGLSVEDSLEVIVVEQLDFVIDDQKIIVTNVGNIVYKKPIELFLGDRTITKSTSLKPGEAAIIDLAKENVESGSYNLQVRGGATEKSFDEVQVDHEGRDISESISAMLPGTGKATLGTADDPKVNPYYAGLGGLAATMLGYLGFQQVRRRNRTAEKIKTIQIREAEKMAKDLKSKKVKAPYKYMNEKEKDKELIEYRDRILADIEKERKVKETREKRNSIEQRQQQYSFTDMKVNEPKQETSFFSNIPKEDSGYAKKDEGFGFSNSNFDEKAEDEDFSLNSKKKKGDEEEDGFFNMFS